MPPGAVVARACPSATDRSLYEILLDESAGADVEVPDLEFPICLGQPTPGT